ncbi:T9SS type A sorting domain-containing protein [Algibacter sp. AS12]|uniref:T9SS type A sorting domain-containing protein n=1 Tax=Algibacter sp. AS12 TaxID=3135773 RepID=UPI00398B369E
MKDIILIPFFILNVFGAFAQIANVEEEFLLPTSLSESSGIIYFNNKLITHNDSGGENKLYEVDVNTEQISRTVTISNATNADWEDITQDDTSIFIGDIGNNNGNRTNLKIYKISKADYTASSTVTAEIIAYSYADQTDFTANPNNNIWDAEALVSYNADNLMLFTKNWVDGVTKAYLIPKLPGLHSISPQATTLNSNGLITGGTYNEATGKLYLVGYNQALQPFIWDCEGFNAEDAFSGTNTQTQLSTLGQEQAEAITFIDENSYYLTSESFSQTFGGFTFTDDAKLISFSTNDEVLSNTKIKTSNMLALYPNPATNVLNLKSKDAFLSVEIFNLQFKKLYQGQEAVINVATFSPGLYFVKVHLNTNLFVVKKFVKQ